MGLFGKSKEIPYDWKFYDGTDLNTNWEVPNLIDALEIYVNEARLELQIRNKKSISNKLFLNHHNCFDSLK